MKFTQDELDCIKDIQSILKPGDRVRVFACPGTAGTITFTRFDGQWIIPKSESYRDLHPLGVVSINKVPYRHAGQDPNNYK